jgi:hypothetical protein
MPGLLPQPSGGARAGEVGAELLRLHDRPLGQLAARDPGREPEVVLDPRAGSCLAADRDHLDTQGPKPLGGAVDRGGQAGRAPTDDHEVEAPPGDAAESQAEVFGQRSRGSVGAGVCQWR